MNSPCARPCPVRPRADPRPWVLRARWSFGSLWQCGRPEERNWVRGYPLCLWPCCCGRTRGWPAAQSRLPYGRRLSYVGLDVSLVRHCGLLPEIPWIKKSYSCNNCCCNRNFSSGNVKAIRGSNARRGGPFEFQMMLPISCIVHWTKRKVATCSLSDIISFAGAFSSEYERGLITYSRETLLLFRIRTWVGNNTVTHIHLDVNRVERNLVDRFREKKTPAIIGIPSVKRLRTTGQIESGWKEFGNLIGFSCTVQKRFVMNDGSFGFGDGKKKLKVKLCFKLKLREEFCWRYCCSLPYNTKLNWNFHPSWESTSVVVTL